MMGPKFCLLITVSAFLIFPLVERATSAKQVQVMTGLHPGNKFLLKEHLCFFLIASSQVLVLQKSIAKFCLQKFLLCTNFCGIRPYMPPKSYIFSPCSRKFPHKITFCMKSQHLLLSRQFIFVYFCKQFLYLVVIRLGHDCSDCNLGRDLPRYLGD
jgi:hypothetical protein